MNRPLILLAALALAGCAESSKLPWSSSIGPDPTLPAPTRRLIPTVDIAPAVGWPQGGKPVPAAGLQVNALATGLVHPRWLHVLPNGDVLVAESNAPPKEGGGFKAWIMKKVMERAGAGVPSPNRITLLRDADGDGVAEVKSVFLENLMSPFGMALVGNDLYVANADAIVRFAYEPGALRLAGPGSKVVDLPGGPINHHWTKNVIASRDGSRLYATVGSNSNVGENGLANEDGRAAIWEVDPKAGTKRLFASGLRNPNGLAWEPESGALFTVVNERDEIGSDLVPDYLTSVKDGAFYGWPYSYWGQHVDARVEPPRPDLVARAVKPDFALGTHVAPLGLATAEGAALPAPLQRGMFVGLHGSWNRKPLSGYKVVFVPFAAGKPTGQPIDVLTGFVDADEKAQGRPVGVAIDRRGALLVADDVGNTVWRVTAAAGAGASAAIAADPAASTSAPAVASSAARPASTASHGR
ncbi:PQQ-dependent sugar dehydrogenase [Piscinibacter koreensis]|uniref:Sorbosone dehydrogenase family protein n=1 Tax=Piscinibacter koreensis TaxID=2742824 RepID=A0A7Y6NPT1_9BURK|nr:sorbosone dehydrogenase family protein [Schlegelella koreensis]NUZ07012.1 sorbosone dehydrogenase family protein [Schlegelella koreensis]